MPDVHYRPSVDGRSTLRLSVRFPLPDVNGDVGDFGARLKDRIDVLVIRLCCPLTPIPRETILVSRRRIYDID